MNSENMQFIIWFSRETYHDYMESLPSFPRPDEEIVDISEIDISIEYGGRLIVYRNLRLLLMPDGMVAVLVHIAGQDHSLRWCEMTRGEFVDSWNRYEYGQ